MLEVIRTARHVARRDDSHAQLVMTIPQLTEQIGWLRDFEARNGRKLRVLHVGNICNNAYLAAKFLRRAGVDADVLCYNYYHIMGMPEWEELDIQHDWHDDYRPRFAC